MLHQKQAAAIVLDAWSNVRSQMAKMPPIEEGGEPRDYKEWEAWHQGPYRQAYNAFDTACKRLIEAIGNTAMHHTHTRLQLVPLARNILNAQPGRHRQT